MRKKKFINGVLLVILVLPGLWSHALLPEAISTMKAGNSPLYPAMASVKPRIDGNLDEDIWQSPPLEEAFITYKPRFGETLPFKTWVWMAYDSQNLYFAFLCHDPEPGKIKAVITERDKVTNDDDDCVGLSLDPQGTGQATFDYYVNSINTQVDDLYTVGRAGHSGEDFSQNFVWQSGARKTEKGYQVEICIPLKSIRFKASQEVKMKILFWRRIARLDIQGSWPEWKDTKDISGYWPVIYKNLGN